MVYKRFTTYNSAHRTTTPVTWVYSRMGHNSPGSLLREHRVVMARIRRRLMVPLVEVKSVYGHGKVGDGSIEILGLISVLTTEGFLSIKGFKEEYR